MLHNGYSMEEIFKDLILVAGMELDHSSIRFFHGEHMRQMGEQLTRPVFLIQQDQPDMPGVVGTGDDLQKGAQHGRLATLAGAHKTKMLLEEADQHSRGAFFGQGAPNPDVVPVELSLSAHLFNDLLDREPFNPCCIRGVRSRKERIIIGHGLLVGCSLLGVLCILLSSRALPIQETIEHSRLARRLSSWCWRG